MEKNILWEYKHYNYNGIPNHGDYKRFIVSSSKKDMEWEKPLKRQITITYKLARERMKSETFYSYYSSQIDAWIKITFGQFKKEVETHSWLSIVTTQINLDLFERVEIKFI